MSFRPRLVIALKRESKVNIKKISQILNLSYRDALATSRRRRRMERKKLKKLKNNVKEIKGNLLELKIKKTKNY